MNFWILSLASLLTLSACGRGGSVEGGGSSTNPVIIPTPNPTSLSGLIPSKQYIGGINTTSGTSDGLTYQISIGLSHFENLTLLGGGYSLIIGGPQQANSQ